MTAPLPTVEIGVFPASERARRRRLFGALEAAFPVHFRGREPGELGDLDAVLELGRVARATETADLPALSLLAPEPSEGDVPAVNTLASTPELDRRLRGAVLPDMRLGRATRAGAGPLAPERAIVLAESAGMPTWVRAGKLERALLVPAELAPDEALRERLCVDRSAALLPLVHFLHTLTASLRWRPPPARACLLFDDPNLHWPSYGFVNLRELGEHARAHGYHVALATIPLDARFAHPAAVRAIVESRGALSLLVHGNDHNGGELARPAREAEGVALAAQALRRVEAFERRTGIPVDRVMAPPHERCSEATLRGLLRCGFDAITMTQPFPWLCDPGQWLARPVGADALVGWHPVDCARGLPVLLRHPMLRRDAPELVLRSFLDQPLILYGHHDDLRDGLGALERAADDVNRLRETRWCSVGEIAAGCYETRLDGSRLDVRLLTRGARVEVPSDAEEILVEPPGSQFESAARHLTIDGRPMRIDEPVAVAPGTTVEFRLPTVDGIDIHAERPPRRRPTTIARRIASECRDRLSPLAPRP